MIEVEFYAKPDKGSYHMRMTGHALSAPKGEDLVCAGASALAYTLAQVIAFQHSEGELKCPPKIELEEGYAKIIATPTEEKAAETLHSFFVIQAGMHLLAHNFPEAVHLKPFATAE